MDFSNIAEVYEASCISDANDKIRSGWILLTVAPGMESDSKEPYVLYCLGKQKTENARQFL